MATTNKESVIQKQAKGIFNRPGSSHLLEESYSLNYNYEYLDKETSKQLKDQTVQIRTLYTQSLNNVISIGKFLYNIKYNVLETGEYGNWLRSEFEEPGYFTHDTASNFINAYVICEKFSQKYGGIDKLKPLNLHTIYVMSQEELIDRIQSCESLKRKQVQNIIRQHKFKQKAIDALAVDVSDEQNQNNLNFSENSNSNDKNESADVNPVIIEDLDKIDKVDLIIHELPKVIYYNHQLKELLKQTQEKLDNNGFLLILCGNHFYLKELISLYELFDLNYFSLISFKTSGKNDFDLNIHCQLLHSVLFYKGEQPYLNDFVEDFYESMDELFKLINSLLHNKSSKKFFHKKHY